MSGLITSFFYNPKVVSTVATLYNNNSMWPLFIRDITLDVPGRLYQASRRDGYGNEEFTEQLIEQGGTSFIWGLGVPMLRTGLDKIAVNTEKLPKPLRWLFKSFQPIKYNNISTELLDTTKNTSIDSQTLTYDRVQRLAKQQLETIEQLTQAGQISETEGANLTKMAKERASHLSKFFDKATKKANAQTGLLRNYNLKANTKLVVASIIPAFMIAIGLPLIFQYVTRQSIKKKKQEKAPSVELPEAKKAEDALRVAVQLAATPINGFNQPMYAVGPQARPLPADGSKVGNLAGSLPAHQQDSQSSAANGLSTAQPSFSGLQNVLNIIRNSDKWNTLLVDGVISGGRVAIARNIYDSLENLIQEVGTIYFLFFAMKPLQKHFGNLMRAITGAFTKLPDEVAKHFYDVKQAGTSKAALAELESFRANMLSPKNGQGLNSLLIPKRGKNAAKAAKAKFEDALFNEYQLEKYLITGKKDNVLFEMAKKIGAIDMIGAGKGKKGVSAPKIWNYAKQIDMDAMYKLAQGLKDVTDRAGQRAGQKSLTNMGESTVKWFTKRLNGTGKVRGVAWLMAALTSSAFLAWGVPRFKQKVTEWLTGHDKFPGKFNEGRRSGILNADVTIHEA
jgi:hypothetical protein